MQTITALIVDDESNSRDTLQYLLQSLCPQVTVIGEAENTARARELITKHNPQLVFLDIQMPGQSGIEFMGELTQPSFDVIFTTAYDEYAVKAFRLNAIDYLLKPINPDELVAAVEKLASSKSHFSPMQLEMLKQIWSDMQGGQSPPKNKDNRKLAVSTQDGVHFIELKDIIWCESLGAYTKFHLANKSNLVVSKLIKEYEDILSDYEFIRVHQSYIINLQHVKKYSRLDGGTVEMSDGAQVEVSRRRKDDFQKMLSAYSVNEKQ